MGKESDLYDPYNTKTIGGDLRLDVDTYENVQDNIHLESVNRKLLELTDLIGRVTNNRSASGPIPGTGQVIEISLTSSSPTSGTVFTPEIGEVWQITGASTGAVNASRVELFLRNDGNLVEIGAETAAATQFDPDGWNPVYIDNKCDLSYFISGLSGDTAFKVALIRVR